MSSKDYYSVLEVSPSATTNDIKKSYRRLAHKYHPDKHSGNKMFETKFREIQEAYKILSDEKKRQDYNYKLFDRLHGLNKKRAEPPVTATMILQRSKDLRKRVSQMDPDRMNRDALRHQIENLFTPNNVTLITAYNDYSLTHNIIENVLHIARHLDYTAAKNISKPLVTLAGTDNTLHQKIHEFLKAQRLHSFWQYYQLPLALVAAVIFCLLIYFISR